MPNTVASKLAGDDGETSASASKGDKRYPENRADRPQPASVGVSISPFATISDREFLPAALEILTTPPSPIAHILLWGICGLLGLVLLWSYFGRIDIYAVAPGRVQLSGRSKIIQPQEAGKVVAIHVRNGSSVNAGDVVIELDPTGVSADLAAQKSDLDSANAEAARRRAELVSAHSDTLAFVQIDFPKGTSDDLASRERRVLGAELNQLRASVASLNAQLAEKRATTERLASLIQARQKQLALAKERVDMRKALEPKGAGSRALTIEAMEAYQKLILDDTGDRGQLVETDAAITALARRRQETITQFIADQSQKLAEIERKRDRLNKELVKAKWNVTRTELKAPVSGTVQQLVVSTIGQVVSAAQSLMTVVPFDGPIEVTALIANRDVGFVRAGQQAVIKIDSFPFTRYGTIDGIVTSLSRDAVDERTAGEMVDQAALGNQSQMSTQTSSQPQNLVFPATIKLAQQSIDAGDRVIALTPGMTVTVEIKTGRRRILDYLLSPLRQVASEVGHER